MQCPFCSYQDTKVLESRVIDNAMRRRRECLKCSNRFTTYETVSFNLKVIKRDGREEEFLLQKIARSIEKVIGQKDQSAILALAKNVEQKILNKKVDSIKTKEIGRLVLQELRKVDRAAFLRFAAVYKSVHDPKVLETSAMAI